MDEINKKELARIVGHDDDAEYLKKEVKIVKDKRQCSIRIPTKFVDLAKIDPSKDMFEFTLVPIREGKKNYEAKEFTIEADLKKG